MATADAHDFATSDQRVELLAALMFFYAVGAIAAPYTTSTLIASFGPAALFSFISVGHIALVVFGLSRMRIRSAPQEWTRYIYAPRTSFGIGRLLGRSRDKS